MSFTVRLFDEIRTFFERTDGALRAAESVGQKSESLILVAYTEISANPF